MLIDWSDPPRLTPAQSDVIKHATALVSLWKVLKVSGLSRQERNATIEMVRERLIEAVDKLA